MKFLYQAGIYFYLLAIRLSSLYNAKARQFIKGRKNWQKFLASKIETNARYIWFHCASLGEFEQGRPLIEEIKNQFPEYRIVLTFFSPSGYEIRKSYELADVVMYLPPDTKKNARTFLKMIQPEKAFFIKYEYWYFYISELKKRNTPLYIVSAIFRHDQQFFKKNLWGKWYLRMLHKVTHIFVQDENSEKLLQSAGIENYSIAGDTRFDRVATIAQNAGKFPVIPVFKNGHLLLVAGSTWKPDEELLAGFINNRNDLKTIIAPHEVTPANLSRLDQLFSNSIRFSQMNEKDAPNYRVLIIDSIGMLSSLYQYGNLAYIGGGFGVGIHNILEAATFGLPLVFGPNFEKFREAVDLKILGGAYPIKNADELDKIMSILISDAETRKVAAESCKKYIAKNTGSTQNIIRKVFNI
jgi:3-deoxy-D-manno-octulosonic-acid transferase